MSSRIDDYRVGFRRQKHRNATRGDLGAGGQVGCVYVVEAVGVGRVKIGCSVDPYARIESMRTACPVELKVRLVMRGDYATEAALHSRFANRRVHGEWFLLCDEIEEFLAAASRSPGAAAVAANREPVQAKNWRMLFDLRPTDRDLPYEALQVSLFARVAERYGPVDDATRVRAMMHRNTMHLRITPNASVDEQAYEDCAAAGFVASVHLVCARLDAEIAAGKKAGS